MRCEWVPRYWVLLYLTQGVSLLDIALDEATVGIKHQMVGGHALLHLTRFDYIEQVKKAGIYSYHQSLGKEYNLDKLE